MLNFLSRKDISKGVEEFNATSSAVLLDVRSREEYRGGHVPGSINIDVSEIEKVSSVISDKATPIFAYCHSGSRSGLAVSALKRMGYTNVKNIGGITSYTGATTSGN